MTTHRIIGLGHQSRVGKDTAYGLIKDLYRDRVVARYAFADGVRRTVSNVWGVSWLDMTTAPHRYTPIGHLGGITPIELQIGVGNKMREIDPDVWCRATMSQIANSHRSFHSAIAVVTDVRFPNEAQAIRDAGGLLVKITRDAAKGQEQASDHNFPDDFAWDHVVENNGTIDEFRYALLCATRTYVDNWAI